MILRRKDKGFTLIELLVAIATLGALGWIVYVCVHDVAGV